MLYKELKVGLLSCKSDLETCQLEKWRFNQETKKFGIRKCFSCIFFFKIVFRKEHWVIRGLLWASIQIAANWKVGSKTGMSRFNPMCEIQKEPQSLSDIFRPRGEKELIENTGSLQQKTVTYKKFLIETLLEKLKP